jgi:hypothetical protein
MRELSAAFSKTPVSDLPLTSLRELYRGGQISRKDFEERIFRFLLDNQQRFHLFNHDREAFTDYLCWLYPRLRRAIDAYQEAGASFDAYIGSVVRWSSKEYRSRAAERLVTERACWETRAAEESATGERAPAYLADESFKPVKNPRQVLVLLLKSYFFVSDDFIDRVAPAIGVGPDELTRMIDRLHKLRDRREEKIRVLQEKLNCQYYRCAVYQRQLESLPETSARRETARIRLERARARYSAVKKRLAAVRREASNSQVARVLGVPKGTVDSTLYAVKHRAAHSVRKSRE